MGCGAQSKPINYLMVMWKVHLQKTTDHALKQSQAKIKESVCEHAL